MKRSNGHLEGSMRIAACVFAAAMTLPAQTFTTLHSFSESDGAGPAYMSFVQGFNGDLYGTTLVGGTNGTGTVFTISRSDAFASLTSNLAGGNQPLPGLILAPNGTYYGTTYFGGSHSAGEVFKMNAAGAVTALYGFCPDPSANCPDGANPVGGVVLATNGKLYGTTSFGGASDNGTVFSLTTGGTLTTLHSFCVQTGCADGSQPEGTLVQASNGKIYGSTNVGGAMQSGTIFSITPGGAFSTVHTFCSATNCADGGTPVAGLTEGTDGNLYGTTLFGGSGQSGVVYKLDPTTNTLTTLYAFCSQPFCTDGSSPFGPDRGLGRQLLRHDSRRRGGRRRGSFLADRGHGL